MFAPQGGNFCPFGANLQSETSSIQRQNERLERGRLRPNQAMSLFKQKPRGLKPIPSKSWSVPFCSGPCGPERAVLGPPGPSDPGTKKKGTRIWKDRFHFFDNRAWEHTGSRTRAHALTACKCKDARAHAHNTNIARYSVQAGTALLARAPESCWESIFPKVIKH